MSPFTQKRARKVLGVALFAGIVVAGSGVLLVLEADSAEAASPVTISAPGDGSVITTSQPTFSGTATSGEIVTLATSQGPGCSATADGSDTWSCQVFGLTTAQHVTVTASGNLADFPPNSVTDDDSVLWVPNIDSTSGQTITSSNPQPTFTGEADPGAFVHVGLYTNTCDTTALGDGTWSCAFAAAVPDAAGYGDQTLGLQATQKPTWSSGTSDAIADTYILLRPLPDPTFSFPVDTTGGVGTAHISITNPTLTGTAAPNANVNVTYGLNGFPSSGGYCSVIADSSGKFTCPFSGGTPMAVGKEYYIRAEQIDTVHPSSLGAENLFFMDIVAPPAAPAISSPASGFRTIAHTISVSGTSAAGTTVRVFVDGGTACNSPVTEEGTWGCSTPALSLGVHSISAIATDAYGTSSSSSAARSVRIVRQPGVVPPAVIPPTPTPTPTPTPIPTPDPTSSPGDSSLAITGNKQQPHDAAPIPRAPAETLDSPTTFSTSLHSITATKITPLGAAVSGGVAGGFILLVAFPSELLKNTIRENYESAFRWLAPTRRWFAGVKRRAKQVRINPWLGGSAIILIAALLLGFANPGFGFNGSSVRLWFALVLSLAGVNVIVPAVTGIVSRRAFSAPMSLRPLPAALILVLVSAVISRIGHIEPGFLFAGVLGVTFGAELGRRRSGILAIVSVGVTVVLGLGTWLAYSAVAPIAEAHPSFWNLLWSEVLSAMTIELLATLVISLLPLRFLDGATIFAWKKWVWAVAYFSAVLILIFVIAPISNNWGPESAPLFGWGVFFIAFALVAVGIWAMFRLRSGRDEGPTGTSE